MLIVPLVAMTSFLVLGIVGTVGKLLYDEWQFRQLIKPTIETVPDMPKSSEGFLESRD